jgi:uncharacterized protein with GYD domain
MATFILFGRYSPEALKGVSSVRTKKALTLVKKFKGKILSMYALLGEKDLMFIADFPGVEEAMQASVALHKLTGISFSTTAAVSVDTFDKLMAEI